MGCLSCVPGFAWAQDAMLHGMLIGLNFRF